jgi:GNAT superfamily N-acetyltransferase
MRIVQTKSGEYVRLNADQKMEKVDGKYEPVGEIRYVRADWVHSPEFWRNTRVNGGYRGQPVGTLTFWEKQGRPEVLAVQVHDSWQRQGIATEMWKWAKERDSRVVHSSALTPNGRAWVEHLDREGLALADAVETEEFDGVDLDDGVNLDWWRKRLETGDESFHLKGTVNDHNQADHAGGSGLPGSLDGLDSEIVETTPDALVAHFDLFDGEREFSTKSGARVYLAMESAKYVTLERVDGGVYVETFDDLYELEHKLDLDLLEDEVAASWRQDMARTIVYHGTPSENLDSIRANGLERTSKTRGINNRWVGPAVYANSSPELVASYGDALIEVDLPAAISDGTLDPLDLDREPGYHRAEAMSSVAWAFNDDTYDPWSEFGGTGEDPSTVVIHDDIPPRYLTIRDDHELAIAEFHLKGTVNDHNQDDHAGGGGGAAGELLEAGMQRATLYESARPVWEHPLEDKLAVVTSTGEAIFAITDDTRSSVSSAYPRWRQRLVSSLNGVAQGYEMAPTSTKPEVIFVDEPDANGIAFVDPKGVRFPQNQVAVNLDRAAEWDQYEAGNYPDNLFMPAVEDTPNVAAYTGAHEYGHVRAALGHDDRSLINTVRIPGVPDTAGHFGSPEYQGMSRYARSHQVEAHAEAFAEWSITGGKTDNAFALFYAETFGWGDEAEEALVASAPLLWEDIEILGDSLAGPVYTWGDTADTFHLKGTPHDHNQADHAGGKRAHKITDWDKLTSIDGPNGRLDIVPGIFPNSARVTYHGNEGNGEIPGQEDVVLDLMFTVDDDGNIIGVTVDDVSNLGENPDLGDEYRHIDHKRDSIALIKDQFDGVDLTGPDWDQLPQGPTASSELGQALQTIGGFKVGDEEFRIEFDESGEWVKGRIIDVETGEVAGGFKREFDGETLYNNLLEITPWYQGKGIGTTFADTLESAMAERGALRTELQAADVGRYAWAARGYEAIDVYFDPEEYETALGQYNATQEWSTYDTAAGWLLAVRTYVDNTMMGNTRTAAIERLDRIPERWEMDGVVTPGDLIGVDSDVAKEVLLNGPRWRGTRWIADSYPWRGVATGGGFEDEVDPNQLLLPLSLVGEFHLAGTANDHNQADHAGVSGLAQAQQDLVPGRYYKRDEYPALTSEDDVYKAGRRWAYDAKHSEMTEAAERAVQGREIRATAEAVLGVGLLNGMDEAPKTEVPHYRGLPDFDPERGVAALTAATPELDLAFEYLRNPNVGRATFGGGVLIRFEPGTPYREAFGGSWGQTEESIVSGRFEFTEVFDDLLEGESRWDNATGEQTRVISAVWKGPAGSTDTDEQFHLKGTANDHNQADHAGGGTGARSGRAVPVTGGAETPGELPGELIGEFHLAGTKDDHDQGDHAGGRKKVPGAEILDKREADRAWAEREGNARRSGQGDCYIAAYQAMKTGDEYRLVHGVVTGQGELEGVRFDHAWVEHSQKPEIPADAPITAEQRAMLEQMEPMTIVIDNSNGLDIEIPAVMYYRIGQIDPTTVARYTYEEMARNMVTYEHYGPWDHDETD